MNSGTPKITEHVPRGQICCDDQWEAAYERFETPEQEIQKFIGRLKRFGFESVPKDARIAEMFCGRGNGLVALETMGFTNVVGLDLSDTLLDQYAGPFELHLADCTDIPLDSDTFDAVIVHGGLHHLPTLPRDLEQCLAGVARILKRDGTFYAVEPWSTPFLVAVHMIVQNPLVRKVYAKGDALAEMIDRERVTYEQWLRQPSEVAAVFDKHFESRIDTKSWGKLTYAGTPR